MNKLYSGEMWHSRPRLCTEENHSRGRLCHTSNLYMLFFDSPLAWIFHKFSVIPSVSEESLSGEGRRKGFLTPFGMTTRAVTFCRRGGTQARAPVPHVSYSKITLVGLRRSFSKKRLGFLLTLALCWTGAVSATDHPWGLNENHPYGRLTSDYVTPHVAWGNPYHAGKIRALILAPTWSQRETVELAQRLALDYTPFMTATFMELVESSAYDQAFRSAQPPPEVVNRALREALKKSYDVMVIGKLNWPLLPPRQRLQILEKVSEGTGLVYINPPQPHKELELVTAEASPTDAHDFILGGVPIAKLPAFRTRSGEQLLKTALFGKGRVVILDYAEKVPDKRSEAWPCLTPAWDTTSYARAADGPAPADKLPEVQWVPYEYYQSLVAKATVWAAGKESPIQVRIEVPDSLTWPVSDKTISVVVVNAPENAVLQATVRDRFDRALVYPLILKNRRGGGGIFALPDLSCGEYFLDAWVWSADRKTIQTWGSAFFTVTDEFVFGELSLKNTLINAGDKLEGALALPRMLKEDERLFLDLHDNFQRRILTEEISSAAAGVSFSMPLSRPLTTLHRLEARLMRGNRLVARKTLQFPVRCRRGWDDFNEVIWDGGGVNNYIPQLSLRKLVADDEGDAFDIGWRGATAVRNVALANGLFVPYQSRFGCFGKGINHIIPVLDNARGCMSQPSTLQQLQKWGEQQSSIFGPYGPFAWTHGDETFYSLDPDVCWCDTCLETFRHDLRSVYPNLEALNAEWKTAFAAWEEVKPLTLKEAREKKVYAPWIEHCLANNRILATFYRKSSEALAAHDPDNRAGFDGCNGITMPNSGIDWWRLSREVGVLQDYMYNGESLELIRSFGRPDQLRGQWYGTYGPTWKVGPSTVPYCHFFPWNALFHGMNSTWFWTMSAPGPLSGYAPDLTRLPFFAARAEALKTIKSGAGKLLLNSKRIHDGVAVHFSETSRIADTLYADDEGDRSETYLHTLADVNRALEYAGLQYQYLSYDQVSQGELNKGEFKVFIMPHSRSVTDAECKAIREFVRNGGVLIADILPAVLNGHGTAQAKSLLADLFLADEPHIVNSIGKGKTALISNLLSDCGYAGYNDMKGWKAVGNQPAKLVELLTQTAGIQPAVRIVHRGEGKMPPTEIMRFEAGTIQWVGLLRGYWLCDNNPYPATITFPRESHLYDVINGKYLGLKKEIAGEVSYRAQLYAMSPYRVRALQVNGPDQCVAGNSAVFSIEARPEGKVAASQHVFRVEVIAPSGRNLRHYAVNALAGNGSTKVTIPWALNDGAGRYTIVARDIMSGTKAEWRVELKEAK